MKDFFKGKFVTVMVVVATVILAGVAIYTALRLYGLRKEAVAPNAPGSQPFAWDCSKYTFSVSSTGTVTARNDSSRNEPAQQAKVYINGNLVNTLNVPTLTSGQSATLGTVQVPSGSFSWRVEGTSDCSSSGTSSLACQLLTFTITQNTPTITPTNVPGATNTPTPLATLTPTQPPVGGISDTPTPSPLPTTTTVASPTPTLPPPPSIPEPPNCPAQKPDAPILTSVKKTGTEAVLTWTSVSNATHYVISYGTSPTNLQYGVPNTGKVTTYTIGSLNATGTYYFTVYAVNDCMPSEGSALVSSVAGTSTSTGTGTGGGQLPSAGISTPTFAALAAGTLILMLAVLLAI